jgi:hypothetical protein
MCCETYMKFDKDWFKHSKVLRGAHIQIHRQEDDLISLLLLFQNKESRLKTGIYFLKDQENADLYIHSPHALMV